MKETLQESLQKFHAGQCDYAYEFMGCHAGTRDGQEGWFFRVWAPNARAVSVIGEFNFWNTEDLYMTRLDEGGVWEAFSVYAKEGQPYKYCVTQADGRQVHKIDPYGLSCTPLPDPASRICDLSGFTWHDALYRRNRGRTPVLNKPLNIYEVHAGSWKRRPDGTPMTYDELARELAPYAKDMGYTHIELLPVMEHPYEPSWGYQVTGYYAPSIRWGTPRQLMEFVDICHSCGLGVILDWVPAHFPKDLYGLYEFDGTSCYELPDPLMREHPEWGTRIFDYGRGEVASFLLSSAVYWLKMYHADGIRVDAVTSMLYLNYARKEWHPNRYGGEHNLEAIEFLRKLNHAAFQADPHVLMIAEESTAYPMLTKPPADGGLGFLYKWNMGWMNDMLKYMALDPIYRSGSHNSLTFSMMYAFSENYILPLSHDEVVHGKKSLLNKMPGSYDDQFCNLRTLYGFMMAHPGKKLRFMGHEFGQYIEWREDQGLDWLLLDYDRHRQMQDFVRELNRFYLDHPQMWQNDSDWEGFQWHEADDRNGSVVAFRRMDRKGREVLIICNFTPVLRENYLLGLDKPYWYVPVLNSDETRFGGYGFEAGIVRAEKTPHRNFPYSGKFRVPPMSVTYYVSQRVSPLRAQGTPDQPQAPDTLRNEEK